MENLFQVELSWQNSFHALHRNPSDFTVIGAFRDEELLGYGIIDVESGDIPQLALRQAFRRKGIGSMIFYHLKEINQSVICKVVNIESVETGCITFVTACGIQKIVSQYEVIKHL